MVIYLEVFWGAEWVFHPQREPSDNGTVSRREIKELCDKLSVAKSKIYVSMNAEFESRFCSLTPRKNSEVTQASQWRIAENFCFRFLLKIIGSNLLFAEKNKSNTETQMRNCTLLLARRTTRNQIYIQGQNALTSNIAIIHFLYIKFTNL